MRLIACSMMSALVFAVQLHAEDCSVVESRGSLAPLSGARISAINIESEGPELPGGLGVFRGLHSNSRLGLIRRRLLFAPGDTVDTLLMGETMRRLRAQRLFSDAVIIASQCDGSGGTDLLVRTRDTWTFRPTMQIRSASQISFGVEERNLFGSARTMSLTREMTTRGNGGAFNIVDPFLFDSDISGNARVSNLAGTHALRLGLRLHEFSTFDPWRVEANIARQSYGDTNVTDRTLRTVAAMSLIGHRVGSGLNAVYVVLAGAEFDSAANISTTLRTPIPGAEHARSFVGADFGLQRRTAEFDNAEWLVPGRGFLDVPVGWEGEGVVAAGYERNAETPAIKLDTWIGRVWLPKHSGILMLDGWLSGYYGHNIDQNQIARASIAYFADALNGMWAVRFTAEQLYELDPDRRGLSMMPTADFTTPVVRPYSARGGRSLAGSIDRDVHVLNIGAASVFNVGGFLAGSYRWDVDSVPNNQLKAGVVGARFRLLSANGAVSSVRIDVGYPVIRSEVLSDRPFFILTFGSLFDVNRQRDGRRVF